MKTISSTNNELIKNVIRLNKAGERKEQGLIIIEGSREISLGIEAGYKFRTVFICNKYFKDKSIESILADKAEIIEVSEAVYSKIAYRESYDGILALAEPKEMKLEKVVLSKNSLIIILETVEKPGNLGAILRTADAAKADAVIICDNQTDIYNPNIIRSSLGSIFTNQVVCCSNDEAFDWVRKNNIRTFATSLKGKKSLYDCELKQSSAILMGSEAFGLSDFWHKNADELIKIPMNGRVDSLNVSVSTAIAVFEAIRQRTVNN